MDDWVRHFVSEERARERDQARQATTEEGKREHSGFQLRTLVDLLGARVADDVRSFAREFPERAVTFEGHGPGGGFMVRRAHYPEARLIVEPDLHAGAITVTYVFASQTGIVAPRPRVLELGGQDVATLHFRDSAEQHAFRTLAQLSEYLLMPVFTGCPR